ncbi:MAG: hypothetical protein FK734_21760 [Asgard group archaeon]|nr:hypothetical protein [Asgard group archaeon]
MKATFILQPDSYSPNLLEKIAENFGVSVRFDDDGIGRFILVQPKLQIKERKSDDGYYFNVWGASQENIDFFKTILGEPFRTEEQRLTPLEFAQELTSIPGIMEKSKEEIMELMEVDDRQFTQYQRLIQNQLRRPEPEALFIQAAEILEK